MATPMGLMNNVRDALATLRSAPPRAQEPPLHPNGPAWGTPTPPGQDPAPPGTAGVTANDDAAVERYRYMLRTAAPEAMEQAHAEAFAQLTPEQRRAVLAQLSQGVPSSERSLNDDPQHLARMATRAEIRQPGTMERILGRAGGVGGIGVGGLLAGGLLASVAGGVIGSAIGNELFNDHQGGASGWPDRDATSSDNDFRDGDDGWDNWGDSF